MEAPKCKICGTRHYGLCTAFPAPEPDPIPEPEPTPPPTQEETAQQPIKAKFDKNAYQREYMRKWRAEDNGQFALYTIVRKDEPQTVKIGMSRKWRNRKQTYGEAIAYSVYFLGHDIGARKLIVLEAMCGISMNMPPCRGREWFETSIEHARTVIERVLTSNNVPFTCEHGPKSEKAPKKPSFDRNAYQREYMRRVRQKPV